MSKIEWTEKTWSPIIGCSKISPGCDNCYAARMAHRLMHMPYTDYYQFVLRNNGSDDPEKFKNIPEWNGTTHLVESALDIPVKRKKPTTYFVCSMGDLFHESVPDAWLYKVFEVMEEANHHRFLLLTKRPERAKAFFIRHVNNDNLLLVQHIWLGVTAENQEQADKRIPILLQIPAAKRFVSIEPMLEPIEMESEWHNYLEGWQTEMKSTGGHPSEQKVETNKLDWVICGGESGPKARPMHPGWARDLMFQCWEAQVPFFFKQQGEWSDTFHVGKDFVMVMHGDTSSAMARVGKKAAGYMLDGEVRRERP